MRRQYNLVSATDFQIEEIDRQMYDLGMDDYVWFENGNQTIVTEMDSVVDDLEKMLDELEIEYEVTDEE